MTGDEKREQVAKQCDAVAHMANAIAGVHTDFARIFRNGGLQGVDINDQVGGQTAAFMERLGDMLNAMDAVDDDEDEWMTPIFRVAQEMWPVRAREEAFSIVEP